MNFNDEQQLAIQAEEPKVVVLAAAASGKTTVLIERIKYLLDRGVDPSGIVAITFTNAAAENIRDRIGLLGQACFIGTIHSYANSLLVARGIDTTKYLASEKFDDLFYLVQENLDCIKPVDHLLLDEAQDSTLLQFKFLLDMVKPNHFFLVGDHKQSIYRWNGADPRTLLDLYRDPDIAAYTMRRNYRNGHVILDFAKQLIKKNGNLYLDNSIPMREEAGKHTTVQFSPQRIAETLLKYNDYKNWFILCRWNNLLSKMRDALDDYQIPYDTFKRSEVTYKELNNRLKLDRVKLLTIHAAKGLEADNVIVIGAVRGDNAKLEENCVNYVAATRAKNWLIMVESPRKKKEDKYNISNWE